MHHDASRDSDGKMAYDLATGICHLVRDMRMALDIVAVEEQLACMPEAYSANQVWLPRQSCERSM